jgi:hypothetical protein
MTTPPPTPPEATWPMMLPISMPPSAMPPAPSIDRIDPPRPPPTMPEIELTSMPWSIFGTALPATLPPITPEMSAMMRLRSMNSPY